MRDYEVVYIFNTQLPEENIQEKLDRFHTHLTQAGGEITAVDDWGRRQLAYPIAKQTAGHYVVAQLQVQATQLPEFERLLKLDEELLRYLLVLHEGEPTAPMSIQVRSDRPSSDDDDGEDEEG